MRTTIALIIPATLAAASLVMADGLNFESQTSSRINMTVGESSANEKEVEFGDIDNDGDLDVVVAVGSSDFGQRKNKLYRNDDGVFNEISGSMIPEFGNTDVTRNAFIRDYNGDGFNDIYIINDSNSDGYAGRDHVFIAEHMGGVLTGYSEEGATRITNQGALGAACGGVSFDFDGDGDLDVYSGNYPGPSQDVGLYNNGEGKEFFLANATSSMVPADGDYTVDVALGDMNGDGKMDLLISNWGSSYIYYNDNGTGSTGLGDYRYSGSTQNIGNAGANENAMEPADFDNDGDMDIYWANHTGANGDRILENLGNDGDDKATFITRNVLPSSVTSVASRKASVADFDDDGRIDVFVSNQSGGRPSVLRNTTVNGDISFVDWSPADVFTTARRGWHGAVFDTNGDGDIDILLGAFTGDHLFENVPANAVDEGDLGPLPPLWNTDPLIVTGNPEGAPDAYTASDIGSGFVSVVLQGEDDYLLEALNSGGNVIALSDRGGVGVEEALQVSTSAGTHTFRVTINECGSAADLDGDCNVGFVELLAILSAWGPCDKCPEDLDFDGMVGFSDLLLVLEDWGISVYTLEVLGRSG